MSIQTRQFEQGYLRILEKLIEVLADKILKSSVSQNAGEAGFARVVLDLYAKLARIEHQKLYFPKFSLCVQQLSTHLVAKFPDSRCTSSESSVSRSDTISPIPMESGNNTAKGYFWNQKVNLDQIEEEDDQEPPGNVRFHSQPRKAREISPTKSNFKYSLPKNFAKPEDIMGKYAKMTEGFLERKKIGKEDSLFFNNGIFFHVP